MPRITVASHEIRFRSYGDDSHAPPLMLIHGAAGGQYVWLEQRSIPGCRVVTLDLPGHGRSQPPLSDVTVEGYADVVAEFATALDVERFVAVGHSMGGAIALTLALHHAPRIAGLGLLATGARMPVSDLIYAAIDTAFDQLGGLMAQIAYAPTTDPARVERFTAGPLQCTAQQARADFEACTRYDVRERLGEIAVPALILAGRQDQLIGAGRIQQLAAGIAHRELRTLDDAGHMLMQEQPDRVNAALSAFVSGLPPAA